MIITFGTVKGGVGKTTLLTNLTYMRAVIAKKNVLLVDADDHQWSSSDWVEQREAKEVATPWTTVRLSEISVRTQIQKMMHNYDDIFIDTGGRDSQSLRAALTISDMLICPFQPKSYDVWTMKKLKKVIDEMAITNPRLKYYAVINRGDVIGSDNEDAREILSEIIPCLPGNVCQRKVFSNTASRGLSIFEAGKSIDKKAINEINNLYDLIFENK
jgi:chromosome partitioning protein